MSGKKVVIEDEAQAVAYLEKVVESWDEWIDHHRLLVESIKILLNARKEERQ